jgi:hypothetical protein
MSQNKQERKWKSLPDENPKQTTTRLLKARSFTHKIASKLHNKMKRFLTKKRFENGIMKPYPSKTQKNSFRGLTGRLSSRNSLERRRNYELAKQELAKRSIRLSKFLEKMCMDSGYCMAFGREKERIRTFFENMDFKYLTGDAIRIGADSANGVVHMLKYMKDDYSTYAIMKSSKSDESDSLLYEYIVGKYFINNYVSKYPCFMETYDLYEYNNYTDSTRTLLSGKKIKKFNSAFFQSSTHVSKTDVNQLLHGLQDEIEKACNTEYGVKYAVLIEYLKDPITFEDYLTNEQSIKNKTYLREMLNILIQVYIPLGNLMRSFTHNDLHSNNVLLYKVPDDKYVEMQYYVAGKKIVIQTQYIAKMIDYGRCYFEPDKKMEFYKKRSDYESGSGEKYILRSKDFVDILENATSKFKVGDCNGFVVFDDNISNWNNYVSAGIGNISQDIRFISTVYKLIFFYRQNLLRMNPDLDPLMSSFYSLLRTNVKYTQNDYGGSPVEMEDCPQAQVCNVEMLRDSLMTFYLENNVGEHFAYDASSRLGVMKIYDDGRDMQFVKE